MHARAHTHKRTLVHAHAHAHTHKRAHTHTHKRPPAPQMDVVAQVTLTIALAYLSFFLAEETFKVLRCAALYCTALHCTALYTRVGTLTHTCAHARARSYARPVRELIHLLPGPYIHTRIHPPTRTHARARTHAHTRTLFTACPAPAPCRRTTTTGYTRPLSTLCRPTRYSLPY